LLPYLYQCFFIHYLTGDPILRPLLYHYEDRQFEDLDDQFLVGDGILVAPILEGEGQGREIVAQGIKYQVRLVLLPQGWWFDLNKGEWTEGGRTLRYAAALEEIPLFVRDGAIIPYYNGPLHNSFMDKREIELHLFSKERPGELCFFIDDQETRDYQTGRYNAAEICAQLEGDEVRLVINESGSYERNTVHFLPVLYGCQGQWKVVITSAGKSRTRWLSRQRRNWVCKQLPVLA
jgi:alpha-glucosidase (family GH31 glycosyl hydrolase)